MPTGLPPPPSQPAPAPHTASPWDERQAQLLSEMLIEQSRPQPVRFLLLCTLGWIIAGGGLFLFIALSEAKIIPVGFFWTLLAGGLINIPAGLYFEWVAGSSRLFGNSVRKPSRLLMQAGCGWMNLIPIIFGAAVMFEQNHFGEKTTTPAPDLVWPVVTWYAIWATSATYAFAEARFDKKPGTAKQTA
jgi:hypothetical protein